MINYKAFLSGLATAALLVISAGVIATMTLLSWKLVFLFLLSSTVITLGVCFALFGRDEPTWCGGCKRFSREPYCTSPECNAKPWRCRKCGQLNSAGARTCGRCDDL